MHENTIQIGDETVDARRADSVLSQARGHMFRREAPDWALVFPRGDPKSSALHMLFVPFDLTALFIVDGVVAEVADLESWTGYARAEADTVIEIPRGMLDVEVGHEVTGL